MDSPLTAQENEQQVVIPPVMPQNFSELMNAIQRVFNISLYYPSGHHLADQAINTFLASVKKGIHNEPEPFLRFTVTDTTLSLQNIELDCRLPSVKTFHGHLHTLNISSLAIHRDITPDEARQFFGNIISFRAKIQHSRNFSEMRITGMPKTIRIHHHKFVAGQASTSDNIPDHAVQATVDSLLSSLEQQGIEQELLAVCRQLLLSIPDALKKRQASKTDLPSVTWSDVEQLLSGLAEFISSSTQDAAAPPLEKHYNIDALIAILTTLENPAEQNQSRETVRKAMNLLIDLTKGSSQPRDDAPKADKGLRPGDRPGISINELKLSLLPMRIHPLPSRFFERDRGEQLSIFMLILGRTPDVQVVMGIRDSLHDCFATPLRPEEWNIVVQGMRQLVKTLDSGRLQFIFFTFLTVLRSSEHTGPLIFFRDFCRRLRVTEFASCWPFLINELLIEGPQQHPELFHKLCSLAGRLPEHYMRRGIPCLKQLDAMGKRKIAADIFSPPPPGLYSFFIILLQSSQAVYICKKFILGLQQQAIGWLDRAVAPFLDGSLASDRLFLIELLQQADPAAPDQHLKKKGIQIIIERLPALSLERREEKWVPGSIAALSAVRLQTAYDLLTNIARGKQYLLLSQWPKAARTAARNVLTRYYPPVHR
ncbi:MAG: hypothetical protein ACL93V_01080 [Candidatus Electrothrix sp. YB6]